jgi:hydroxymethylpyrimidine/phosphomethylpyrimidine kinase
MKDIRPSVVKIGLVPSVQCAQVIANVIQNLSGVSVVLDPVLTSGRGDQLGALEAIVDVLLPIATLVVPNSVEARSLVARGNQKAIDQLVLDDCGSWLASAGAQLVLITGSHENTSKVRNTLYNSDGVVAFEEWPRLPDEYHGSGCMLASSIASFIALGYSVESAVKSAQGYTWEMLHRGYRIGSGQLVPSRNILERDIH